MSLNKIESRILKVQGALNIRELGGYIGSEGRKIKRQRFIRGGSLHKVEKEGIQVLVDMGLDCVVDLRSTMEVSKMPDVFAKYNNVSYYNVPMLDYIQSNIDDNIKALFPGSLEEMYTGLIDNSKDSLAEVLRILADKKHKCTLFHCTAGKDRTGITAMLLLDIAGVDHHSIIEDYSWSTEILYRQQEEFFKNKDIPNYLFESKPESMRYVLDHLDIKYGGVTSYLSEIGINQETTQRIIEKMFD